jgi:hypothetical protein
MPMYRETMYLETWSVRSNEADTNDDARRSRHDAKYLACGHHDGDGSLFAGVVTVAGLDQQALLVHGEIDLVVAVGGGVLAWGVAETVL